jgi:hypothetical protein
MSSRKFSGKAEVLSYRAHFKHHWQVFIHENFEGPEHVAHVFKINGDTALKWWRGDHAPQGWVIGQAGRDNPDIRDKLIEHLWGDAA